MARECPRCRWRWATASHQSSRAPRHRRAAAPYAQELLETHVSIFLSWHGSDAAIVTRLRNRLQSAGLTVWDYREQMTAGGQVSEDVLSALRRANAAVFCLSDEALKSNWVPEELATAEVYRREQQFPLEALIPVRVGPMSMPVPPQLQRWKGNPIVPDLSATGAFEDGIAAVMRGLESIYPDGMPIPVPAVLYAMTGDQIETLLSSDVATNLIEDLCVVAGMKFTPPVLASLKARYGKSSDDFAPFGTGRSLKDDLERAQRMANYERKKLHQRPVSLVWMTDRFARPAQAHNKADRAFWSRHPSLMIVDSVSALDQRIARFVESTPAPCRGSMVLWVPPFTEHTAAWEGVIEQAASFIGQLMDAGYIWRRDQEEDDNRAVTNVALDIATGASTRQWLRHALLGLADDDAGPNPNILASLPKPPGGGMWPLRDFNRLGT